MKIQRQLVITVSALLLAASHLLPAAADSSAAPSAMLVTCINFNSGKELLSKTGSCLSNQAIAKWRLAQSDTPIPTGPGSKELTVCSNQESSAFAYRLIRSDCPKHQVKSVYYRNATLPAAPIIANAVAYSDVSAAISLVSNSSGNPDAPVAYYTISISNGESRKVKSSRDLRLVVSGLKESTTYTFSVTATNADGTSAASTPSDSVTTKEYVPPVVFAPASMPTVPTCATGGSCVVGDVGPGGGLIFYVAITPFICGPTLNLACTYLEVAPTAGGAAWTDAQLKWSSDDDQFHNSGGSRTEVGTGFSNTMAMLTTNGSYSADTSEAAYATRQYSGPNAKNDWYLPSKDELNQLCKWQRGQVWESDSRICNSSGSINNSTFGATNAGFSSGNYWSSTESQRFPWQSTGWNQEFQSGSQSNSNGKNFQLYIRAIRAF
jgi:hypothetical protein